VERVLIGKVVVEGAAEGAALVSKEALSFWGGICPRTGRIIDQRHELTGAIATGKIFVFPKGKGSSTSSATLAETIRKNVAPAAIINLKVDPILALGSIVADELYHQSIPVVVLKEEDFYSIKQGDYLTLLPNGKVLVGTKPSEV